MAARLRGLIREREIFIRGDASVHYFILTVKRQIGLATAAVALCVGLVGSAGYVAAQSHANAEDRALVEARTREIAQQARDVAADRAKIGRAATDLQARQDFLEEMTRAYLPEDAASTPPKPATSGAGIGPTGQRDDKDAPWQPAEEMATLQNLRQRQDRFADRLRAVAEARAGRAEQAIRQLGLNPAQLKSTGTAAMGGPLEPLPSVRTANRVHDARFVALADAFRRMARMEQALGALPGTIPAAGALSSNFGYRSDPFTGEGAFHAGIDFPGPAGSPIYASAPGVVAFIGQRSGYGNVVEVDHGAGIVTRYAHLSGFASRVGERVDGGQMIARMGSTGRSTGSHLHFEVRLDGAPLNPLRFLQNAPAILSVRTAIRQRGTIGRAA